MQATYFERLLNPQTRIDAERELLELGEKAVPVLVGLFNGEARNAFRVQYRQLGHPFRCAIEIAARLGPAAKPLEPYLREEIKLGNAAAARAPRACRVIEFATVEVLAQSLSEESDLASETAVTIMECGEKGATPVVEAIQCSERAESAFAGAAVWFDKRQS